MLEFQEFQGNIFDTTAEVIIIPVNCVGVMGAGLAKQFANRHPAALTEYQTTCAQGLLFPGTFLTYSNHFDGKQYVLLPTKIHWNQSSSVSLIDTSVRGFFDLFEFANVRRVAFPKIGCGLGGLDWAEVRQCITSLMYAAGDNNKTFPRKVIVEFWE